MVFYGLVSSIKSIMWRLDTTNLSKQVFQTLEVCFSLVRNFTGRLLGHIEKNTLVVFPTFLDDPDDCGCLKFHVVISQPSLGHSK